MQKYFSGAPRNKHAVLHEKIKNASIRTQICLKQQLMEEMSITYVTTTHKSVVLDMPLSSMYAHTSLFTAVTDTKDSDFQTAYFCNDANEMINLQIK